MSVRVHLAEADGDGVLARVTVDLPLPRPPYIGEALYAADGREHRVVEVRWNLPELVSEPDEISGVSHTPRGSSSCEIVALAT